MKGDDIVERLLDFARPVIKMTNLLYRVVQEADELC